MGFLGYDKRNTDNSQTLNDQRVSATEGSLVPYGAGSVASGGSVFQASDDSILNLTDNSRTQLSYLYNDPLVAQTALEQQAGVAQTAFEQQAGVAKTALNKALKLSQSFLEAFKTKDDTLASVLESNADLALSAQTGGDSERNKVLLWMTLGVLALMGWIFWKR